MTKKNNITELVFILDRSGSMHGLEGDTIGGFNSLIEKQRKENGECFLDRRSFRYRSGDKVFEIPTDQLPALAFSCGEEFELYWEGELHYFYPVKDRSQCARWALFVDLLAEKRAAEAPAESASPERPARERRRKKEAAAEAPEKAPAAEVPAEGGGDGKE